VSGLSILENPDHPSFALIIALNGEPWNKWDTYPSKGGILIVVPFIFNISLFCMILGEHGCFFIEVAARIF
jgi:hypothetical protein